MQERAEDLQLEALRAFTLLSSLRDNWGGALVVACGLGRGGGQALSIAANIAGAGCMVLDHRPDACRAAMRFGACDFLVNSVDEALRVLKNEIRKGKPVSVALSLDEETALAELMERGVQPELFAAFGGPAPIAADAARRFSLHGAVIANLSQAPGIGIDAGARLAEFTSQRGWSSVALLCLNGEQLRERDAQLLQLVPPDDPRRRWFAAAPRFFHRDRPHRRLMYLGAAERETMGMKSA